MKVEGPRNPKGDAMDVSSCPPWVWVRYVFNVGRENDDCQRDGMTRILLKSDYDGDRDIMYGPAAVTIGMA